MEDRINTYEPQQYQPQPQPPKKKGGFLKGFLIFLLILAVILAAGFAISKMGFGKVSATKSEGDTLYVTNSGKVSFDEPYVGVLNIEGTISEAEESSLLGGSGSYHHRWLLDRIADMKSDPNNKGILFFVNTPGGSVYASDELYFAIKDYKDSTSRPVYSYMASQATSGGYYVSAPCDRILANRNCWTGSIGVTIGTLYDVTGLMEKLGVKSVTITSGDNKAMGSSTEAMSKEQRQIFQSLVDEAYDQFVGIVAEGRHMDEKKVRELADGRIYTAKQAKEIGLIDGIMNFQDAETDMTTNYNLSGVKFKSIVYKDDATALDRILNAAAGVGSPSAGSAGQELSVASEYEALKALMAENQTFTVSYLAPAKQ